MDKQSRKAHIRAYREAVRPMGVWRVRSTVSGHGVMGTSRDLPSMLNRQRAQLSGGAHPDKALQEEWDRRGTDAFVFEVLDTLKPRDDPGYDPTGDLEELARIWRERLGQS
jgi:hypothetical protein